VKTSTTIALTLAALMLGPLAAFAQTDQPAPYRHDPVHRYHRPHHIVHHRLVAHNPAEAPAAGPAGSPPPATNPMFKPYAHPGEGDDDGLSRDPDDCMKGCIGGNPG
jgi:hypothetical protein